MSRSEFEEACEWTYFEYCLLHKFDLNGTRSGVFFEGGQFEHKTERVICTQLSNSPELYTPEGQTYFSEHKEAFRELFEKNLRRGCAAFAGKFSQYPHSHGVHSTELYKKLEESMTGSSPLTYQKALHAKYGISDEWTFRLDKENGRIHFINKIGGPSGSCSLAEIANDLRPFCILAKSFDAFSHEREKELIMRYEEQVNRGLVPIGIYGQGHSKSYSKLCLEKNLRLHIILPPKYLGDVKKSLNKLSTSVLETIGIYYAIKPILDSQGIQI